MAIRFGLVVNLEIQNLSKSRSSRAVSNIYGSGIWNGLVGDSLVI